MTRPHTLIFLATFNEADNVERMYNLVRQKVPEADILFVDDNSPDGTGQIIGLICKRDHRVHAIYRKEKMGIGSAHQDGIAWAYKHGYSILVTMDCDFSHSPEYISEFLSRCDSADVVVGTRFVNESSLREWHLGRKILTHFGHALTRALLDLPFDATGAFRCYALNRIPKQVFGRVPARDYAFFFQSLQILHLNKYRIVEVPIIFPARVYGDSKMVLGDIIRGFAQLLSHAWNSKWHRNRFLLKK